MKKKLYYFLFRIFSYLSDRTNGVSFIVKYKLIIGTLIVGMSACNAASGEGPKGKEAVEPEPVDTMNIVCYDPVVLPDDTMDNQVEQFDPPIITCYDSVVTNVEEVIIRDEEIKKDSME
ncbi:MAG: hypothetical protein LBL79_13275 [Prevotella sp.]|jgi:hypothetical protein|nr:hypothetical protein [Prevotella sp.]